MKTKKILFPVDFSKFSDAALPLATSLARAEHAELIVLHVQEIPIAYAAGEWYYGPIEPNPEDLTRMLEKIRPDDPNIVCIHRMVMGDPTKEILQIAEEEKVDMIVMSTHGRTGLERILMGSVAEKVVRRANCPVVTVRQKPAK
jgi:nucleotide-binding universal stress UspA family protein